ncbi:hypothetical protein [Desulforamulus hydrothermalis]|nr:hypothetical protein [Desulforamulus hydrothermalis]
MKPWQEPVEAPATAHTGEQTSGGAPRTWELPDADLPNKPSAADN